MRWYVIDSGGRKIRGPYRAAEVAEVTRSFLERHGQPYEPYGELRVVSDNDLFDQIVALVETVPEGS